MIKNTINWLVVMPLIASCQLYNSQFDCPPGCGIPCKSVTEIESMIVETEEGPDYLCTEKKPPKKKTVWIAETRNVQGEVVREHEFELEGCCR